MHDKCLKRNEKNERTNATNEMKKGKKECFVHMRHS